nr:MAG TPA: portal protein [Caudoviricetes sp.]
MANHTVINDITNYAEAGPNSLDGVSTQKFRVSDSTLKLLQWLSHYYDNMSELRKKWKRAQDFVMGRQLEEKIEWNGRKITIREYMELQGMPILEYDVISDKLISLVGLVRQQRATASCTAVDPNEEDYISFFNEYLRQNDNNNNRQEMDARLFYEFCVYGFIGMSTVWDRRNGREAIFNDKVDIFKLAVPPFFKPDLSDIEIFGVAHDLTWREILAKFTDGSDGQAQQLNEIYLQTQTHYSPEQGYQATGEAQLTGLEDFLHSSIQGKYRVIEVWTMESRQSLWVHDWDKSDAGFMPMGVQAELDAENESRKRANVMMDENGLPILDENGEEMYYVDPKELNLIEYEPQMETFWYRRYITPNGYLLDARESPYFVLRDGYRCSIQPYSFLAYPCLQGEVKSLIMRMENNQRTLNHYMMMINFVVANGAKGTLLVDDASVSDKVSPEENRRNYNKTNGEYHWDSSKGGEKPEVLMNKNIPAGVEFMINFAKTMAAEGSGVQGALQGVHRNTSGKQYQLERESASTSVTDFVESFNCFKLREAKLKTYLIQEFCNEHDSVKLVGDDYRTYFNPETMRDMDLDVAMDLDSYSATIRDQIVDLLWQLKKDGDIDAYTMLTNGKFPGTYRIRKYLKEKMEQREAMEAQMAAAGQVPTSSGGGQQGGSGNSAAHLKDSGSGLDDLANLPSAS